MSSRNATGWMWSQACELLDQADRRHRQFFRLAASARTRAVWEPPVDIFEDEREIVIVIALPGVAAEGVEIALEAGALVVRAERRIPSAGTRGVDQFLLKVTAFVDFAETARDNLRVAHATISRSQ